MTPDPFRNGSLGSGDAFRTRPFELARDAVVPYAVREPRPRTLDAADLLAAVGELALRKLPGVSDVTLAFWRNDALLAEVSTDIDLGEVVGAHDVDRPGPVADVLRSGGAVQLPDLERESRWPEAAHELWVRGFRSCAVAALRRPRFSLAVVVYSPEPGPLAAPVELDAMLGDWVSTVMRNKVRGVV
ncbi:hypothetical protein LO772_14490 [Yinghuangia sp. ASG 101]|uniref:hypothetical protein n=1 Tax=Yinghuangia sp. ASG 101 TaxID=2896848 RepID=UPI001E46E9B3|nr:hypothetical protein [Yinghuangia sp. ASG 101]UGQ14680.1 hypothetical protein LO772_14490 [Yinghuangia sp. ASG 101]